MECGYVCFESEADAETAIKEIAEFKMAVVV
jgi:RNA recognition motif-containing protein